MGIAVRMLELCFAVYHMKCFSKVFKKFVSDMYTQLKTTSTTNYFRMCSRWVHCFALFEIRTKKIVMFEIF